MKHSVTPRLAVIALALGGSLAAAKADVIYDNLGPGNSVDWWPPYGMTPVNQIAVSFTVTHTSIFSKAQFIFDRGLNTPITYTVSIRPDAAGAPGATSLYSYSQVATTSVGLFTATGGSTVLTPGTYWMRVDSDWWEGGWYLNAGGQTGSFSFGSNGTSWTAAPVDYETPVMRVEATAVPEPATMAALGLGAVALLKRRKRA